jgi:hypothetical protein
VLGVHPRVVGFKTFLKVEFFERVIGDLAPYAEVILPIRHRAVAVIPPAAGIGAAGIVYRLALRPSLALEERQLAVLNQLAANHAHSAVLCRLPIGGGELHRYLLLLGCSGFAGIAPARQFLSFSEFFPNHVGHQEHLRPNDWVSGLRFLVYRVWGVNQTLNFPQFARQ